jgi:hypothetical protein
MAAPPASAMNISISERAIRDELRRVLASREFHASHRCQDFLSYVVEAALSGHGDTLKERTIGVDVFARTVEYDPSEDATVRVKAGEVRKKLTLYYVSPDGVNDPIIIELQLGTYVPVFHNRENGSPAVLPAPMEPAREPAADSAPVSSKYQRWLSPRSRAVWLVALLLSVGGIGIIVSRYYSANRAVPIFDQFWAPVFQSNEPALLCVTPVPVYSLQFDSTPKVAPQAKDFVVIRDQFVAVGDLNAEAKIATVLERAKKPVRVRIGNIPFEDLRKAPAIMVGYSYSRWKEISKGLRFFIDLDQKPIYAVSDNGVPTAWRITTFPDDPNLKEDYGIITRVFDPDTGQMLVEIAGISHYGTESAADVLTNPVQLARALHNAPTDWQKKNIQIVIHAKVISGAPASPTVVATYFW